VPARASAHLHRIAVHRAIMAPGWLTESHNPVAFAPIARCLIASTGLYSCINREDHSFEHCGGSQEASVLSNSSRKMVAERSRFGQRNSGQQGSLSQVAKAIATGEGLTAWGIATFPCRVAGNLGQGHRSTSPASSSINEAIQPA